jgi:four helix bundle protein
VGPTKFRTYDLAVKFHRSILKLQIPLYLRDQLLRSSSSTVLNIAEGWGKISPADKRRLYSIALGSLRESCAALDLMDCSSSEIAALADQLGACLWRLCNPK